MKIDNIQPEIKWRLKIPTVSSADRTNGYLNASRIGQFLYISHLTTNHRKSFLMFHDLCVTSFIYYAQPGPASLKTLVRRPHIRARPTPIPNP